MILGHTQYGAVGWYLVVLGLYRAICDVTGSVQGITCRYFWCWVSRRLYWSVIGGTGSVWGGTGWFLVVLGQYGAELVDK